MTTDTVAPEATTPFWTKNPIAGWSKARFWTAFAILLVLAVGCVAGIVVSDRRLATTCTPTSAALEWVASPRAAENIVTDWRVRGVIVVVQTGVWIDYGFLVCYSTLLAIVVFRCARAVPAVEGWAPVGDRLGWWMWVAGLLDAIENAGILLELSGRSYALAPFIALVAREKWTVVVIGLTYVTFTVVLWLRYRATGTDPELRGEFEMLRTPPTGGARIRSKQGEPAAPAAAPATAEWLDQALRGSGTQVSAEYFEKLSE